MASSGAGSSVSSKAYLSLSVTQSTQSPANNQTTVNWSASVSDGNASFGGWSTSEGSWSVTVNGISRASASGQSYDFGSGVIGSPYFPRSASGSFVINHNSNGTAGPIAGSASFAGNSSEVGSVSVSVSENITSFTGPSAPSAGPTLTRTSPFTTIGITSATPTSNGSLAPTQYDFDYNTDNSTWGNNITSMGGTTVGSKTLLSSTTGYYFRTRAVSNTSNSWGTGAWSASTFRAGVPSAPATISTSRSGLSVTVTITASATDGGATVSAYTVERSTDGVTWSSPQDISSLTYTYTNLTPGQSYTFRAYATNSTGASATQASSSVFVSAYGKRYQTVSVTGVTAVGTTTTYTAASHGFSLNDPVSVTEITPSSLNASGTVTAITTNSFTLGSTTPTTTSGTYGSGGTAGGWRSNLVGKRYDGSAWVDISTAQKYTGTSWASFS